MKSKAKSAETAEQAALDFLRVDFNQCFEQLRYYDNQIIGIPKFMFVVYTFLAGLVGTLHQVGMARGLDLNPPAVLTLAVGLLLGFFLFAVILRNRLYFIRVARYVNEHRRFFLAMEPLGFAPQTNIYTRSDLPRGFNRLSSHAWLIYIVALLNALVFFGVGLFVALMPVIATVGIAFFVFGLQIAVASLVLRAGE